MPPGQRYVEAEEPMIREQRDYIQKLENEFESLKERAITLDKTWTELKFLDALLENAGSLYET
jgi:predicted  nucleic acid-binding Zn-ribbon protein